jgi:hypothetical protein
MGSGIEKVGRKDKYGFVCRTWAELCRDAIHSFAKLSASQASSHSKKSGEDVAHTTTTYPQFVLKYVSSQSIRWILATFMHRNHPYDDETLGRTPNDLISM